MNDSAEVNKGWKEKFPEIWETLEENGEVNKMIHLLDSHGNLNFFGRTLLGVIQQRNTYRQILSGGIGFVYGDKPGVFLPGYIPTEAKGVPLEKRERGKMARLVFADLNIFPRGITVIE